MRPINALVDITNYVMLATGNPTHAFDADNIKDHIRVRRAEKNEKLLLLNGKDLELNEDDLVIADVDDLVRPVVAVVMAVLGADLGQFPVQVEHPRGACTFVEVIYILGNDAYIVPLFKLCQQFMCLVWLYLQ